jgi:hypothetical protein
MFGSSYNGAYCTGNAAFGLVGNSQYDQCGRWCAVYCSGAACERGWAAPGWGGGREGRVQALLAASPLRPWS